MKKLIKKIYNRATRLINLTIFGSPHKSLASSSKVSSVPGELSASVANSVNIDGYIPIADDGFWQFRCAPTESLNKVAELFNQIHGETIIEIGTGMHGKMAGNSMLVWPKKTSAKRIIAIDLEQQRLDEVNEVTRQYSNVELILADGIEYLEQFSAKIDLLYLDFWTPDREGTVPGSGRMG